MSPSTPSVAPLENYARDPSDPSAPRAGEDVVVTEKVDGQGLCFVHDGDLLWAFDSRGKAQARSSSVRLVDGPQSPSEKTVTRPSRAWAAADRIGLEEKLSAEPDARGLELWGELRKDADEVVFFDVRRSGSFLPRPESIDLFERLGVASAPVLFAGPWDPVSLSSLSSGPSLVGGTSAPREGFVARSSSSPERAVKAINPTLLALLPVSDPPAEIPPLP